MSMEAGGNAFVNQWADLGAKDIGLMAEMIRVARKTALIARRAAQSAEDERVRAKHARAYANKLWRIVRSGSGVSIIKGAQRAVITAREHAAEAKRLAADARNLELAAAHARGVLDGFTGGDRFVPELGRRLFG